MKYLKKAVLPFVSVIFLIAIFYAISAIVGSELIFPSPTAVAEEFFALFLKKTFYKEVLFNLWRTFYSFLFAFVLAVLFAVIGEASEVIRKLFYPIMAGVRATPTIAIILWVLIIFDTNVSPAVISFIVTFPMIYSAVYSAIKSRDKNLDDMAKVYGVKKSARLFKIVIPEVFDRAFPQICSTLSFNVKLIVSGEALSYTKLSLGREMQIANANLEVAKLFALTVVVILISVMVEMALRGIVFAIKRIIYGYNRKKIMQIVCG